MNLGNTYPRDMVGYGKNPPHPRWPREAQLAVQFVLNFEEGSEMSVLHGDVASETFLSEIVGAGAFAKRHMSMESLYEYGSRAGLWRVLRAFEHRNLPLTIFAVALAIQKHPDAAAAFKELGHEIACHGLRWISYQEVVEDVERDHIAKAIDMLRTAFGTAPQGWYTGRDSPQTRRLIVEHGGLVYDSDSYADDLPYWTKVPVQGTKVPVQGTKVTVQGTQGPSEVAHLVIPYALDTNDMRFATVQGFNSATQFFQYLKDSFDVLYREGDPNGLNQPKMLSVGLHCRLAGRPGRLAALEKFLDYVLEHERVWVCQRIDIARHWIETHPAASE